MSGRVHHPQRTETTHVVSRSLLSCCGDGVSTPRRRSIGPRPSKPETSLISLTSWDLATRVTNSRPLLVDASVLVADERELTRRAQAFVLAAMTDGRIMVASAPSVGSSTMWGWF